MQGTRIYVGGLDTRITERDLEDEVCETLLAGLLRLLLDMHCWEVHRVYKESLDISCILASSLCPFNAFLDFVLL